MLFNFWNTAARTRTVLKIHLIRLTYIVIRLYGLYKVCKPTIGAMLFEAYMQLWRTLEKC